MLPLLVGFAEQFLLAGGVITLEDLAGLSKLELTALAAAGRRLRAEDATQKGIAAAGVLGAAEVLSEIDGGATRDQVLAELGLLALEVSGGK